MQQLAYILPAIQLTIFAAFTINVARLIINQLKNK
jgi:hypothetical protein